MSSELWPNPRLQRTRAARFARTRSPLSRKPLATAFLGDD